MSPDNFVTYLPDWSALQFFHRFLENTGIIIGIDLFELAIHDAELVKDGGDTVRGPQVEDRCHVVPFDNMLLNLCPPHDRKQGGEKINGILPAPFWREWAFITNIVGKGNMREVTIAQTMDVALHH